MFGKPKKIYVWKTIEKSYNLIKFNRKYTNILYNMFFLNNIEHGGGAPYNGTWYTNVSIS